MHFPTGKPLCLLSLCLLIACAITALVSVRGDKSPGFGGCFVNWIRQLKGGKQISKLLCFGKATARSFTGLLRRLYFTVSWCRWAVEAEPYLVILVILMYFILYWIYYPLPPAPFPDFLFSSLELIIIVPSAFSLLSSNNRVRETDFINQ